MSPALEPGELTGYWEWRDALLRHPDGRAVGGEPCVKCGGPVPANAAWKHRDRHVCSSRCNFNLGRQLNRMIEKGGEWTAGYADERSWLESDLQTAGLPPLAQLWQY